MARVALQLQPEAGVGAQEIAEASGEIEFSWVDDEGRQGQERAAIRVT